MPHSTRWSSASAPCRLEWRPSPGFAAALAVLGLLTSSAVLASDMPRALAWPLALGALVHGLWLARHPASYEKLVDDPVFLRSVFNTLEFLIVAINLKMLVALVLPLHPFGGLRTHREQDERGEDADERQRVVSDQLCAGEADGRGQDPHDHARSETVTEH